MNDNKKHAIVNMLRFLEEEISRDDISNDKKSFLVIAKQNLNAAYKLKQQDFHLIPYVDVVDQTRKTVKLEVRLYGNRDATFYKLMGKKGFIEKQFDFTFDNFSKAIRCNPKNPAYWCDRAEVYHNVGDLDKSMKDCEQALVVKPRCARAHNRIGLIHFCQDNKMKGVRSCRTAVMCDPNNINYRNNFRVLRDVYAAELDSLPLSFTNNYDNRTTNLLLGIGVDVDLFPFSSYPPEASPGEVPQDGHDVDANKPRVAFFRTGFIVV